MPSLPRGHLLIPYSPRLVFRNRLFRRGFFNFPFPITQLQRGKKLLSRSCNQRLCCCMPVRANDHGCRLYLFRIGSLDDVYDVSALISSSPAGISFQSTPQSHNSDQPSHSDGFSQPWTVVRNCPARKGRNRGESTRPIL